MHLRFLSRRSQCLAVHYFVRGNSELARSGRLRAQGGVTLSQALAPRNHRRTLTFQARKRAYFLYIPNGIDLKASAPVILAFNGGGGTPTTFAAKTDLSERAGKAGFVVAYPEGYNKTWNAGSCCGEAQKQGIDDVGFTSAVLDDLQSVIKVDQRRVFATGFSNGG